MWKFLTDFVGEGRAGWGVWCEWRTQGYLPASSPSPSHWSTCDNEESIGNGTGKGSRNEEEQRDVLKVYCWGEVVGHIYMVLFIASERMVKGTGARWVDGGGQVVVRLS